MDWADEAVPDSRRNELFGIAEQCSALILMFLTKRAANAKRYITERYGQQPPAHFWFGFSWQPDHSGDLDVFLDMPGAVRFLSAEPLLSPLPPHLFETVDLGDPTEDRPVRRPTKAGLLLQQVIVGGESGRRRRDCGIEAIVAAAESCVSAGLPVWVKQDCALLPGQQGRIPNPIWKLKELPSCYASL